MSKSWVTGLYMKLESLARVKFISIFRTTTNSSKHVEFLLLFLLRLWTWQVIQWMLPRTLTPRK